VKKLLLALTVVFVLTVQVSTSSSHSREFHNVDHFKLMEETKVYYPWHNLTTKCVFIGYETLMDVKLPLTVWLCLWIEPLNKDVAAMLTITSRLDGGFSIEVCRCDGGDDALQLCLEIRGVKHYPFQQIPNKDNLGYILIVVSE